MSVIKFMISVLISQEYNDSYCIYVTGESSKIKLVPNKYLWAYVHV